MFLGQTATFECRVSEESAMHQPRVIYQRVLTTKPLDNKNLKVNYFQNVLLVSKIFQNNNEIFTRISALASKKRSNQKSSISESK